MAFGGLLSLLRQKLSPREDDLSQEVLGTSRAASQPGFNLGDALLGAASGYAKGFQSASPELGLATGFGTGYETAQNIGEQGRTRNALAQFQASPAFATLTPEEQAEFIASPGTFFQKKRERIKPRTKVKLSTLFPNINPESDREVEIDDDTLVKITAFGNKGRQPTPQIPGNKTTPSGKPPPKKKTIPASIVAELGDTESGIKQLDTLYNGAINLGFGNDPLTDKARGLNPLRDYDTKASEFLQLVAGTKQIIGKGLEGGVLRREDEYKYDKIIPKIGDKKEVLLAKKNALQDLLRQKNAERTKAFGRAGYDTSGMEESEPNPDDFSDISEFLEP